MKDYTPWPEEIRPFYVQTPPKELGKLSTGLRPLPNNNNNNNNIQIKSESKLPWRNSVPETNEARPKSFYLGACLIAAARLAREENWGNWPRVVSRISDSIQMAKRIYDRLKDEFPHGAKAALV